ncbi:LysR family transcriptional regulator [Paraburkholderia tuberum]|uniref:DNA-binding transcriptional regulator, LysR family n=1 Tax=Paraburkholderia tuberum TaxID=157910 RepID=A0A1H1GVX5_9BURK|nr:LysR family transcriptional regulator [Paraburkholderia tuberum]SDR17048.1 DNA-binding transcriptional regulator, LysR family [Paraburkholderia tuberum]
MNNDLYDVRLQWFRALVAVAEAGSIRAAAEKLGIAKSTVSENVRHLEACFHMQLIQRIGNGIVLTARGQTLLKHARAILGQGALALEDLQTMYEQPRGRLSFALPAWMATAFLAGTLTRLRERLPGTQLEIAEGYLALGVPRLRNGSVAVLVCRVPPEGVGTEFDFRPLFTTRSGVVARQNHPCADRRSLAELRNQEWLLTRAPGRESYSANIFVRHGLPEPEAIHYVHSLPIAVALLQQTDMLSLFSWPVIELCARRDDLCVIPVSDEMDKQTFGIVTLAGRPLEPAASCFIECLIDTIRDSKENGARETRRMLRQVDLLI